MSLYRCFVIPGFCAQEVRESRIASRGPCSFLDRLRPELGKLQSLPAVRCTCLRRKRLHPGKSGLGVCRIAKLKPMRKTGVGIRACEVGSQPEQAGSRTKALYPGPFSKGSFKTCGKFRRNRCYCFEERRKYEEF